jgi:hypothetical protein
MAIQPLSRIMADPVKAAQYKEKAIIRSKRCVAYFVLNPVVSNCIVDLMQRGRLNRH